MQVNLDESRFNRVRDFLRNDVYSERCLKCIGVEYHPFCHKNGGYSGLFVELLQSVADDLNTTFEPTPEVIPWEMHEEEMKKEDYDTMIAPAFSRGWTGQEVVSFLIFKSGRIVHKNNIKSRRYLQPIHKTCHDYRMINWDAYSSIDVIGDILDKLRSEIDSLATCGKGIGVCSSFIEETFLTSGAFNLRKDEEPLKSFNHEDPLDSLTEGIEENRIFITDSVIEQRFKQERPDIAKKCKFSNLLGISIPIVAGIPIMQNPELRTYINLALRSNHRSVRKALEVWAGRKENRLWAINNSAITWFPQSPHVVRTLNFASTVYWLNPIKGVHDLVSEMYIYPWTFKQLSQQNVPTLAENISIPSKALSLPVNKTQNYSRVLTAVFSEKDRGLELFFDLADKGHLNIFEVSKVMDPTSSAFFVSTLVIEGYALLEGEVIVAKEPIKDLADKMRKTIQ